MKSSVKHSVEPLEARIAPARLIVAGVPNGNPAGPFDTDYKDLDNAIHDSYFIDTEESIGGNPPDANIAAKVGVGLAGAADTHYIRMSSGDELHIFSEGQGPTPFIHVLGGNIVAFFIDKNLDNEVQDNELTGISLGKGARVVVNGSVDGDIVTNLNEQGTATTADDSLEVNGLVSNLQSIGSLKVTGAVGGSIIAGGNISNIEVSTTVTSILAGTAAHEKIIDFYPTAPTGDSQLIVPAPGIGKAGPNISNIIVNGLGTPGSLDPTNGLIKAGNGGVGGKGGNVTFVQVNLDADGMRIMGGDGGDAGGTKPSGGAGGTVSRIFVGATTDLTSETVLIAGGLGGDSATGKGGAGGSLKDIFVGYRLFGTRPFPTNDLLLDRVQVFGGEGGDGKIGGAGGSITNADVRVKTAEGSGEEIAIVGGDGGQSIVTGGRAGVGGSLLNIVVRNQDLAGAAAFPDTLVKGGNAGTAAPGSRGANGGNVTNVTLLGWQLQVVGGNGSEGKIGGNGGSLTNVLVEENDEILAIGTQFDAGAGGNGTAGNGGKGGNINRVLFEDSDLQDFVINSGAAGSGGDSVGGKGGAGGFVQGIEVHDSDASNGATQTVLQPLTVRTGAGGDGTKGGGAGGMLKLFTLDGINVSATIVTGEGGDAVGVGAKGKGGIGGSLDTVSIALTGAVGAVQAFANVTAGVGGDGAGANGAGGAGGDLRTVTVTIAGEGSLTAGKGGNGDASTGAAGRGGSIHVSQLNALGGNGKLIAGDAGDNGGKAGAGGSILGRNTEVRSSLFTRNDLEVRAGTGTNGGAGGSIRFLGYGSSVGGVSGTPAGNISIIAGDGSGEGRVAGAGGSVIDISGSLPSPDVFRPGEGFTASIKAGKGGATSTKGGAGGSVQDILILGGGFDGAVLTVQAGDGGDAANAAVGAKGGNVKNINVSPGLNGLDSIFRSVAAGDGGDARKGGAGGSVDGVFVEGLDIGSRRDEPFGLTTMGGIFAGVAGQGGSSPNGKVVNIVADGIAAIVAGRGENGEAPESAELVDNIILNGSQTLLREGNNVFVEPGPFQLAFRANAQMTVIEGTSESPETQTFKLTGLQVESVEFVLTFTSGTVTSSVTLPGDATAAEIKAALDGLASIKATGPGDTGSVTVTATADGFSIAFNNPGDQQAISFVAVARTGLFPETATAQNVEDALNLLPTIQYLGQILPTPVVGSVNVTGKDGSFYVSFNQSGDPLPIEGIEAFSVNLAELTQGSIDSSLAAETTPGSVNLGVLEVQSGQQALVVTLEAEGAVGLPEVQGINLAPVAAPGGLFQLGFTGSLTLTETAAGDALTKEVQSFNVTAIRGDSARTTFTLSFGGATTVPLVYNNALSQAQNATNFTNALNALAPIVNAGRVDVSIVTFNGVDNTLLVTFRANGPRGEITGAVTSQTAILDGETADENSLETALNSLAAVRVTAPDYISGAVAVEFNVEDSYIINFQQNGDQQLITANGFAREVQEIDHTALAANPLAMFTVAFSRDYLATEAAKGNVITPERQEINLGPVLGDANSFFTLTLGNLTTNPIAGNATDQQIRDALSAAGIAMRPQTGPPPFGVARSGTTLQLTFQAFGDNPSLFTASATSTSAEMPATATEVEVEASLNGLATIKGATLPQESVTVVTDAGGDYVVTFSGSGQRAPIVAALTQQEVQEFDITPIIVEATSNFRLGFGGEFTAELARTATPADVQTALNALASVTAAGGVTVTPGVLPGEFNVQFNQRGERNALELRMEIDEVQDFDFTPGIPVTMTVEHDVVGVEAVPGGAGVIEVQLFEMGAIFGDPDATYVFTDRLRTSAPLPGNADAVAIKAALDAMLLVPAGEPGVTVDIDGTTIQVTFDVEGNQPTFIAHASQTLTDISPTETESGLEALLNDLATVKVKGLDGQTGSVDVTIGTGSDYIIRFNDGGDQLPIKGTQERSLQSFTTRPGNNVVSEIQAFSPQLKGQPTEAAYAIANLIGFYADHTEIDANVFHFIRDGVVMTSGFQEGDQPIDGLVMAKKMNQTRISVTPEAYLVGGTFYDWDNRI